MFERDGSILLQGHYIVHKEMLDGETAEDTKTGMALCSFGWLDLSCWYYVDLLQDVRSDRSSNFQECLQKPTSQKSAPSTRCLLK